MTVSERSWPSDLKAAMTGRQPRLPHDDDAPGTTANRPAHPPHVGPVLPRPSGATPMRVWATAQNRLTSQGDPPPSPTAQPRAMPREAPVLS